jgi:1,5-anhydro-D-fructose reductase (1,5-anhydro-D-mannitol-forming)
VNAPRFGLIGASFVAASRVAPALRRAGASVTGLFDTDEERFKLWQDQGLAIMTSKLSELLTSDIDAVYVSSRNAQHAQHAIAAAKAGKHVLLEKPMALSVADAEAVIQAADDAGVQLAVNHHLPGSPLHVTARRLVSEGRIGALYSVRINHAVLLPESLREWRLEPTPGGGVVFDITVHDASVLNPLFGSPPARVTALGASQATWNHSGTRDSVMTVIEFEPNADGVAGLAQTHDAFNVPFPGTSMEIHGERGAIVIGDAMTQETLGTVTLHTADGATEIEVDCSPDLYDINVAALLRAIAGDGSPTATGADGLAALQIALAAEASLESGSSVAISDIR